MRSNDIPGFNRIDPRIMKPTGGELRRMLKQIEESTKKASEKIQSARRKRILERLAHYEATGNENKASIYMMKLEDVDNAIKKLVRKL